jgi:prepilin-type N-terminal cleavage/methylation domain-containing protein
MKRGKAFLGARTPSSAFFRSADEGVRAPSVNLSTRRAFTLIEVLAALLMMAIVIPVAMEGMSVASRVGVLGQRKAAAMRVAERLLNELVIENQQQQQSSASGTTADGDTSYPWTMRSEAWSEDAMLQLTVTVNFIVRGNTYDVSVSTLLPATPPPAELAATQQ